MIILFSTESLTPFRDVVAIEIVLYLFAFFLKVFSISILGFSPGSITSVVFFWKHIWCVSYAWLCLTKEGILFNFCLSVAHVVPRGNYIAVGLDEVIDTTVCTPLNQANITSLRVFTLEYMFLETFYRKLPTVTTLRSLFIYKLLAE